MQVNLHNKIQGVTNVVKYIYGNNMLFKGDFLTLTIISLYNQ